MATTTQCWVPFKNYFVEKNTNHLPQMIVLNSRNSQDTRIIIKSNEIKANVDGIIFQLHT